jgi:type I restriction enzyme S subunit
LSIAIPVPKLFEQQRIVSVLDDAESLRHLRIEADRLTLAVEPALFQELFGTQVANPFGWAIESVGNLFCDSRSGVKCGPFGSALKKDEYSDTGVPVWGIPNVLPNQFVEEGSLFIPKAKFLELQAYALKPGDLLISRAGTVGRICVARPRAKQSIIGTNLIRLRLDKSRVLPEFFAALLTYRAGEVGELRADTNEASYSFMNTTVLKSLRIYLPPMELQERFVASIAEVRELQYAEAASRQRLDDLFQSLLQRAFLGEV